MSALGYALAYIRKGWPVFPCHEPVEGPTGALVCSCGRPCEQPAKHPRTKHGWRDATLSEPQAREWWGRWPTSNVGIACGEALAVVDIDPRHDERGRGVAELLADLGPISADTPRVATGGNGLHLYHHGPHRTMRTLAGRDWAEIRAIGSYIIAPPSRHISGREYTWLEMPNDRMPALPQRFRDDGQPRAQPAEVYAAMASTPIGEGGGTAGGRHNTAIRLIGYLLRRGVDPQVAWPLIDAWNQQRCSPPLPQDQLERAFMDITTREFRRRSAR